jgi:hypothetical protein
MCSLPSCASARPICVHQRRNASLLVPSSSAASNLLNLLSSHPKTSGIQHAHTARRENLSQGNKLSRSFPHSRQRQAPFPAARMPPSWDYAVLLDPLKRHRRTAQQKVTVEHVTVPDGAVVGTVETPGRGEGINGR